jgi:hypothetical protein
VLPSESAVSRANTVTSQRSRPDYNPLLKSVHEQRLGSSSNFPNTYAHVLESSGTDSGVSVCVGRVYRTHDGYDSSGQDVSSLILLRSTAGAGYRADARGLSTRSSEKSYAKEQEPTGICTGPIKVSPAKHRRRSDH